MSASALAGRALDHATKACFAFGKCALRTTTVPATSPRSPSTGPKSNGPVLPVEDHQW